MKHPRALSTNATALLKRVNENYAHRKLGDSAGYTPPEAMPYCASDQIMALLEVMSAEIDRLEALVSRRPRSSDSPAVKA